MINEKSLTRGERRVVNYVRNNLDEIVENDIKIERLSQEAGSGYSVIYTLLEKLNINGYREFMACVEADVENARIALSKRDDYVQSNYNLSIQQNHTILERKNIYYSLQLIRNASRIYISAWENSLWSPAQEIENFLALQNKNVHFVESDLDNLNDHLSHLTKTDLFIIYTMHGSSEGLLKTLVRIKEANARVILITARIANPAIVKKTDSIHNLIVNFAPVDDSKHYLYVSRSIPFFYFNSLLIYHYLNNRDINKKNI